MNPIRRLLAWLRPKRSESGSAPDETASQAQDQTRWYARYEALFSRQQRLRSRMRVFEAQRRIRGRTIAPSVQEVVDHDGDHVDE